MFTGMDGSTSNCNTTDTGCSVSGLNCGQVYNVSVTAYDNDCYSLTTNITQVSSAPCAPTNAKVTIDCSGNSINVTWSPSKGAESYTVTATGTDGHTHDCNTTSNVCNIIDVHCGETYLISVTAHNKDCSSDNVTVGNFNTVPCVADHVVVEIDCFTNDALVSWQENNNIQISYTAVAHNLSGTDISCSTSSTSCHISGLECGHEYSFWVTAGNQQCTSPRSVVYKTLTAPCQPQDLTEGRDCKSNDGFLSWTESRGALYYTASMSRNGETLHCNSTKTNCTVRALQCGQSYNVSVVALDNKCSSPTSSTTILDTAPCQPQNLISLLECSSQIAELSWGTSDGAHLYELTIHSAKEGMFSYNTSNNYFYELLYCGQNYSFNVMAIGSRCNSSSSQTLYQKSVPCFPQNSEVFMDCKNKSATYSWEANTEALSYLAMVHQDETIVYSCETETTSCLVPNLNCGTNYTFSVLAGDLTCNSSFSSPIVSGVVPCPPDQVETSIYHRTVKPQEVRISWNGSNCGEEYMASVIGEIGSDQYSSFTLNSYWTSYMDFYIPVPCSSSYNVTVTARNSAGVSDPSHTLEGFTAPCTPSGNAQQVVNGNLLLSWDESVNTEEYRVFDLADNHTVCKTSALSCETSYTTNTLYLIAVNEAGESEPTIFPGASRK
uniref:Fibronectin type-III domain-containing protein n=1 Tax=Leptobrachium leishanense TaxID=445787 RepID=A0A8C5WGH5_9ANUR